MSDHNHLQHFRNLIADGISQEVPSLCPRKFPNASVAKSALQKSIRRGAESLALESANYLLDLDSSNFWRRLVVIALEDVGLGSLDIVGQVVACAHRAKVRRQIADDWSIASYLVTAMCRSIKDRTTDELTVLAEYSPSLDHHRSRPACMPLHEVLDIINQRAVSPEELAIAAWYAIGTDRYRSHLLCERPGDPVAFWSILENAGSPQSLIEVCQVGLLRGRTILAALLPLVWLLARDQPRAIAADDLTENRTVDGLPGWVFGGHTREGRRAINSYLKSDCQMSRWLQRHAPTASPAYVVSSLLFRVESGLVDRRLTWPTGDRLRQRTDTDVHGIDQELAGEALTILREELPLLDEARQRVADFTSDNQHYRR